MFKLTMHRKNKIVSQVEGISWGELPQFLHAVGLTIEGVSREGPFPLALPCTTDLNITIHKKNKTSKY